MTDYVEGKRPVIEAMRTDVPLKKILLADNAKREQMIEDILRKARQRDIPVINGARQPSGRHGRDEAVSLRRHRRHRGRVG